MAANTLVVRVVGDASALKKSFRQAERDTAQFQRNVGQSSRGALGASGAFRSLGRSVAFASGSFLGGAGLITVLKSSVDAASNLSEQTNKVNVVFGKSARTVTEFGKTAATSIGIANDQALEAAGTFGNLFRTVNLQPAKNAELSRSLVKLAADMASFNNADPSEVLLALRSGLIGEAEPLRKFGVLLSETRVQQEALRETGKKNTKALTDQEKILARYNLILKDTVPAQGDFARTSDGLANSQRSLTAEVRDLSAALGNQLKPAVEAVVKTLADGIAPQDKHADRTKKISTQSRALKLSLDGARTVLNQFKKDVEQDIGPVLTLANALNDLTQAAEHIKPITVFGVEDRQPGRSPGGPAAFPPIAGAPIRGRASLAFQMSQLQEQLAKAQLTGTQRDDRSALVLMQNLLHRQINASKDLRLRTQLYGDLKGVQDQIERIDQDAQRKQEDARQKELDARKAAAEKAREHADKVKALLEKQRQALQAAVSNVRSEIGALFQGPILTGQAGILGVAHPRAIGGRPTAATLAADVRAQTAQYLAFNKDLARLSRRGAPGQLISELRAGGLEGAPNVHALAGAGRGTLRSLFRAFAQREKLIQQIAHSEITIHRANVTINASNIQQSHTTPMSQRRGRQAGVQVH